MSEQRYIGKPLKRIEDPKLITGQGAFVDDLKLEGVLHMVLVRSPYAHARIQSIDASEALKLPGVVGIYTADDIPLLFAPGSGAKESKVAQHPLLAQKVVRYVGEPIAAVLATSAVAAQDALWQVLVDYDPLGVVVEPLEALQNQVIIHGSFATNVAHRRKTSAGDTDEAFAKAYKVVRAQLVEQRLAPAAMEPRGVLAAWDGVSGSLTVWISTQAPHDVRDTLADLLQLPNNQLRVIAPDVGGGFGAKIHCYPEEILTAYLAKHLGKAVKWVEKRGESFLATGHGRAQVADLQMAFDQEGKILGLRGRVVADMGAYLLDTTMGSAPGTILMLQGPYQIPAIEAELLCVYTNATPTGAYRGAGRPEATYYLERLMDIGAGELGIDPAELRRKNFILGPFPYKTLTGAKYDSGDYPGALEKLLEVAEYKALRQEQARARAEGRLVGIGLCSYVEITGFGWETGGVRVNADGSAVVLTGTSPHGQGAATGFAQIVAERLGIAPERVQVVHGDTRTVLFGMGTMGSRTLSVGGSAVLKAADIVRDKTIQIAAHLLEAAPEDLELSDKGWGVKGTNQAVSMDEVAKTAYSPRKLPKDMEPGLEGHSSFNLRDSNYPFGTHLAMVEVDPDTGNIRVLRYISVDDVGPLVNPLLAQGQIQGGVIQGIGQALWEGVHYTPDGQNLSGSFMDYALPKADMAVWAQWNHNQTTSPTNPLGVKGIGEAGAIGATPAVVNAVMDALGVKHLDMPLTPEKVWRSIH